jgi:anti-anti-sigma factor
VEIDVRKVGRVHVVRMKGQLKLGEPVDELRATLDGILADGNTAVVISMADVPMADSSGIGALVRYQAILKQRGGALKLVSASKMVTQTLRILGLVSMFEFFDDENSAVTSFPEASAVAR